MIVGAKGVRMNKWNIVTDSNLEDGTPTLWAIKVGNNQFYWIEIGTSGYDVIGHDAQSVLKCGFKSLLIAKKWVEKNLIKENKEDATIGK